MKKSDLKHGTEVRNKVSGNIGIVWNPKGGPLGCIEECVSIRTKKKVTEKSKSHFRYTIWYVANLEPV